MIALKRKTASSWMIALSLLLAVLLAVLGCTANFCVLGRHVYTWPERDEQSSGEDITSNGSKQILDDYLKG